MSFKLKGLREKRAKITGQITQLRDKIAKEERALNTEEQAAFDKLKADFVAVGESIKAAEADLAAFDTLLTQQPAEPPPEGEPPAEGEPPPEPTQNSRRPKGLNRDHRPQPRGDGAELARRSADRRLAFQAWARSQHGIPLTEAHRAACKRTGLNPRAKHFDFRVGGPGSLLKTRALSVATNGGTTVAEGFSGVLESALVEWTNLRGVCGQFTTERGGDVPYPTETDTANEGEIVGENAVTAFTDPTFSAVMFGAYKFSSKGILVPFELMQDSEFDLELFLDQQLGQRIGRIQGKRFTTGTGTGQPQGIVTASALGVTSAAAGAITPGELVRLKHSVDPAYRLSPSAGYMMHDSTLAYLLTLTVSDTDKRSLIRASYMDGTGAEELMLNGSRVHVNQHMAECSGVGGVPVTATKHVLYGDLAKHVVRDVGTVRVRRLDERYAEKDQVGFLGFMRSDSRCINTAAIKHLLQA